MEPPKDKPASPGPEAGDAGGGERPQTEPEPQRTSDDSLAPADEDVSVPGRRTGKRLVALGLAAAMLLAAIFGSRLFLQRTGGEGSRSWTWNSLPFPPIDPRYGHAAVWSGSHLIVWGGFSGVAATAGLAGAGIRSDGALFDPRSDNWKLVPPAPFPHRPDIPAIWTGKEMIAWGGDPAQPGLGAAFDPAQETWRALPPPSPFLARGGQSAVWTGSELIVWGGRVAAQANPAEQPALSSAGAAYNPGTDSWREILSAPISPRDGHSAVWTGKEMIIWGGAVAPGRTSGALLSGAGAYDPARNLWRTLPAAPSALIGSAHWTGAEMLVFGARLALDGAGGQQVQGSPAGAPGQDAAGYVMEALAYDPGTNRWRMLPPPPLRSRTDAGAVWSRDRLVVWGGLARDGLSPAAPARDGAAYDPGNQRWERIPDSPIPGRDIGFSMVASGDGAIVWGGKATQPGTSGITFADGAQLSPAAR